MAEGKRNRKTINTTKAVENTLQQLGFISWGKSEGSAVEQKKWKEETTGLNPLQEMEISQSTIHQVEEYLRDSYSNC